MGGLHHFSVCFSENMRIVPYSSVLHNSGGVNSKNNIFVVVGAVNIYYAFYSSYERMPVRGKKWISIIEAYYIYNFIFCNLIHK